jgi:hypothetical protein
MQETKGSGRTSSKSSSPCHAYSEMTYPVSLASLQAPGDMTIVAIRLFERLWSFSRSFHQTLLHRTRPV